VISRLSRRVVRLFDLGAIRLLDAGFAAILLLVLAPFIVAIAVAIKLDSPGPVFYRCRRAGRGGYAFLMLKFRKMADGAAGPALTAPDDERFTRVGRLLARSKLDEIPQLWNVLRGQMSLVGPRPEDPSFIALRREELEPVLRVKPGITGLSQLAFARESEILDPADRVGHYVARIFPQKIHMDVLYAAQQSARLNMRILVWTAVVVLMHREVAVHRDSGRVGLRRRPAPSLTPVEQTGS
jgi:lipopolysaccharide/colanic/teichoic acid biosynthesis glycosyltransferase